MPCALRDAAHDGRIDLVRRRLEHHGGRVVAGAAALRRLLRHLLDAADRAPRQHHPLRFGELGGKHQRDAEPSSGADANAGSVIVDLLCCQRGRSAGSERVRRRNGSASPRRRCAAAALARTAAALARRRIELLLPLRALRARAAVLVRAASNARSPRSPSCAMRRCAARAAVERRRALRRRLVAPSSTSRCRISASRCRSSCTRCRRRRHRRRRSAVFTAPGAVAARAGHAGALGAAAST